MSTQVEGTTVVKDNQENTTKEGKENPSILYLIKQKILKLIAIIKKLLRISSSSTTPDQPKPKKVRKTKLSLILRKKQKKNSVDKDNCNNNSPLPTPSPSQQYISEDTQSVIINENWESTEEEIYENEINSLGNSIEISRVQDEDGSVAEKLAIQKILAARHTTKLRLSNPPQESDQNTAQLTQEITQQITTTNTDITTCTIDIREEFELAMTVNDICCVDYETEELQLDYVIYTSSYERKNL